MDALVLEHRDGSDEWQRINKAIENKTGFGRLQNGVGIDAMRALILSLLLCWMRFDANH